MKNLKLSITLVATFLAGAAFLSAQVSSVEEREALLERVERFEVIPMDDIAGQFSHVADPFYAFEALEERLAEAAAEAETIAGGETGIPEAGLGVSDRELLEALAERIRPSGVMEFGSTAHLIFGQRRVRAGEFISVRYQENDYRLEVVEVGSRTFKLRLNEEVISKRIQ